MRDDRIQVMRDDQIQAMWQSLAIQTGHDEPIVLQITSWRGAISCTSAPSAALHRTS
jgi:hypothetical protein